MENWPIYLMGLAVLAGIGISVLRHLWRKRRSRALEKSLRKEMEETLASIKIRRARRLLLDRVPAHNLLENTEEFGGGELPKRENEFDMHDKNRVWRQSSDNDEPFDPHP